MKQLNFLIFLIAYLLFSSACKTKQQDLNKQPTILSFETSRSGNKMSPIVAVPSNNPKVKIEVIPSIGFQSVKGFGGAFTESATHLIMKLDSSKRQKLIADYFSEKGANYSIARTHINSCDFSLNSYSYAPIKDDTTLEHFSIGEDTNDIIPVIKMAQKASTDGFKLLASPWTAPPWMKDNQDWFGGKLMPEFYSTWAMFLIKYLKAYEEKGIKIWGLTIENEPLGNDSNWESMHYTPSEMGYFIKDFLAPTLKQNKLNPELFVFDQNKGEELDEWATELLRDSELKRLISGTAVHWYASTFKVYEASLQNTHKLAPEKSIILSEACIDAEVPRWKDDEWYWKKEATDWGYDWAPEEKKKDHPKYVPVYRYARDLIGSMNNWVEAWIDWNLVLDQNGGPNHAKNWCIAPVLVDTSLNEVYKTPLFYVMSHFSKFIRPNSKRIEWKCNSSAIQCTAFMRPDGKVCLIIFNPTESEIDIEIKIQENNFKTQINKAALQTHLINI